MTLWDRLWMKVRVVNDWTSCWEWQGKRNYKGYGVIQNNYKRIGTHRVSYELCIGPIPEGKMVCHKCDNPPCVRPSHLWLGTAKENTQDRIRKGRPGSTGRPRKNFEDVVTIAQVTGEE